MDVNNCPLCQRKFGKIFNRKQDCGKCEKKICDKCASRKYDEDGKTLRMCDECFATNPAQDTRRASVAVASPAQLDPAPPTAHTLLEGLEESGGNLDPNSTAPAGEVQAAPEPIAEAKPLEGVEAWRRAGLPDIRQDFRTADDDGSGMLSKEEFKAHFKTLIPFYGGDSEDPATDCWDSIDDDADGYISFAEYLDYRREEFNGEGDLVDRMATKASNREAALAAALAEVERLKGLVNTQPKKGPPPNDLEIQIHSGTNLAAMDLNGLSDPYVLVTLLDGDGKSLQPKPDQTKTIKKTLNPIWNSTFSYSNESSATQNCMLVQFEVMDWDRLTSDDFMGYAQLPLSEVVDKYASNPDVASHKFDLDMKRRPDHNDAVRGHITVEIGWAKLATMATEQKDQNAQELADLKVRVDQLSEDKTKLAEQLETQKGEHAEELASTTKRWEDALGAAETASAQQLAEAEVRHAECQEALAQAQAEAAKLSACEENLTQAKTELASAQEEAAQSLAQAQQEAAQSLAQAQGEADQAKEAFAKAQSSADDLARRYKKAIKHQNHLTDMLIASEAKLQKFVGAIQSESALH